MEKLLERKIQFHFEEPENLSKFEQEIKIRFLDKVLLKQAFTHRSYRNENKNMVYNNERLEFLGDSVVQLVITLHLYKKFPNSQEGELTGYRTALVNTVIFAETAHDLGMEKYLLISKAQKRDTEQSLRHILADTFEAFVGALYLDQGYNAVEMFISGCLFQRIDGIVERHLWRDWKSVLMEKAQKFCSITPVYEIIKEEGPSNEKIFTVLVKVGDKFQFSGKGRSIKDAGKQAAHNALKNKGWL